jgi:trehalose-6-phosphatase
VAARSNDGTEIPLVDGGAFDWLAKLTSNRRAVYIASGLGSQLVPRMFRQ